MPDPPHLSNGIHDETVEGGFVRRGHLGTRMPHCPAFIVDGKMRGIERRELVEQEGPILLGKGIHLDVQS